MRFGIFLPPYHSPRQSQTLAIERDLDLIERLDVLGFDEAWIGEHHSGGYETIPSPELMVAALARRTSRITLASGVISLPYHHPLMVADRIVFLDHLTRGRFIAGFGPGALPLDSYMMGMEYTALRGRMEESLDAVIALLEGTVPVNRRTDWFELRDAQLQVASYSEPHVPLAVAAARSPSGPRLAGKHGLGLISFGGTSVPGLAFAAETWGIMEDRAAQFGQCVDRSRWALVGLMHLADTEEQARAETRYGLDDFYAYHHVVVPEVSWTDDEHLTHDQKVDRINASGSGVIGTPAMAIAQIEKLRQHTGGFGALLVLANDWASREATLRSFELIAREVMPHFDGSIDARVASFAFTQTNRTMLIDRLRSGFAGAQLLHDQEQAARAEGSWMQHDRTGGSLECISLNAEEVER